MSTMTVDEARAVLARIGAGEESTGLEALRLRDIAYIRYLKDSTPVEEPSPPGAAAVMAALDTLRAAREAGLREQLHRTEVNEAKLTVISRGKLAKAEAERDALLGLVRRLAEAVAEERNRSEGWAAGDPLPQPGDRTRRHARQDALLEEARQALGEK